jgi:hypothetical protein
MGKKEWFEVQFWEGTIFLLWNNHERNILQDAGFSQKSKVLYEAEADGTNPPRHW